MLIHSEIKVRGYHLDIFRHVNNARYLEFLEEGRWAFFDGNPQFFHHLKGVTFFVVNININYRRPATLGDTLDVQTSLSEIGNTSGILHQEIYNVKSEDLVVDADVTFVIVDAKTQNPLNLRNQFKEILPDLIG